MIQRGGKEEQPHVIMVSSYKGGVGKTVLAVNLAVALKERGYSALLIDGDTSNPSVGFYLGMERNTGGLSKWLSSGSHLKDVITTHGPTGIDVVNEAINKKPYILTDAMSAKMAIDITKSDYDFVIIDTSPGYRPPPSHAEFLTEVLVVMIPTRPAYSSAVKLIDELDSRKIHHSLVVNMVKGKRYELRTSEIVDTFPGEAISEIPYDEIVPKGIGEKIPPYELDARSGFTKAIDQLTDKYSERRGYLYPETTKKGLIARIINFLLRRG